VPDFGAGDFEADVSLFELLFSDFAAGASVFAGEVDSEEDPDPDDDFELSARLSLR